MPQYDAGPGDWSDRPWEDPDKKSQPHAKRRSVTLPPWALLAVLIAIAIVLCVSLVLVIRGIRGSRNGETPTPLATAAQVVPTLEETEVAITIPPPTATVVLPIEGTADAPPVTEIGPGATVLVKGTSGAGLNLRDQASTYAKILASAKEGTVLTVVDGPKEADGYTWWKLRTEAGEEGWGAGNWLVLQTE